MISILGINIDNEINLINLRKKILFFLESNKQNYIVTPNPEIILQARKDEEFFYILNQADLSLADGFGLKIGACLLGKKLKRFTGADALIEILKIAEDNYKKVLFINNQKGLSSSSDIKKTLDEKFPKLKFLIEDCELDFKIQNKKELISFKFEKNNFFTKWAKKIEKKINEKFNFLITDKINDFSPDIMICNFGAPYQEKFIFHNLAKVPTAKLAIGIGGGIDFLTGKAIRAPKFMRNMGLEWLWRLFYQPQRYKRIYRAVIVFPSQLFKWKFISPWFYRKNVACLLYKKEKIPYTALENKSRSELEHYRILLVERSEDPGHWQLPQGGVDFDTIKRSGSREIYEELGIINFTPKKIYKNLYKYRAHHKGKYGFKGQKQNLLIAEFHGSDADIKINFWDHSNWKWVRASNLINEVHPIRKDSVKIFLSKFEKYLDGER